MPKCSYKGCTNSSKSKKTARGLRYLPFPKPKTNLVKCLLWLEMCGNEKLNIDNISKNTYVCENHFQSNKSNPKPYHNFEKDNVARNVEITNIVDNYSKIVHSLENPPKEDTDDYEHNYSKSSVGSSLKEKSTQTVPRNLFDVNTKRHLNIQSYKSQFLFEHLSKCEYFQSMTGLTVPHFEALYNLLDPSIMPTLKYTTKKNTPIKIQAIKKLTDKDRLCLMLMRLRRGYTLKELSIFYEISLTSASVIFHTWVQFVCFQCCGLRNDLFNGSRETKKNEIPACFRKFEEPITIILDSTEVKMVMSRNFQRQGNTHSSYKHQNSIKFLVGISTRGAIIYNSEGYEGSISDNELFRSSDIHSFLKTGDVLMVDRGFTIQDFCNENNFKLIIPPFLAGRSKLTAEEELLTKKIAKGRIHVERAIQCIKNFQILAKPVQISMLPIISNIFSIICFIVNFRKPLVS